MLDKDHVAVSSAICISYLAVTKDNSLDSIFPSLLGTFIGCQLPDIDTTDSHIGRCTKPISSIISHFGHRGITHSLFGWAMLYFIVAFGLRSRYFTFMYQIFPYGWSIFLDWLLIGYFLHLIEDWFSKGGLIWFFPFGHYRKWYPPVRNRRYYRHRKYRRHRRRKRHRQPVYVETRIAKWFRYNSTDRGKKGRYERCLRYLAFLIIAVSFAYILYI